MFGLDRASQIFDISSDIDKVTIILMKKFKIKNSTAPLQSNSRTIKITDSFINSFKLSRKKEDTKLIVDFNYPRFFNKRNIIPLSEQHMKIEVDSYIKGLIKELFKEEPYSEFSKMSSIELATQINVKAFSDYTKVILFLYRALCEHYESIDKCIYSDYSKIMKKFYLTGFSFKLAKGVIFKVYAKNIENNKKNEEKETNGIIKFELSLSMINIKHLFGTTEIEKLDIDSMKVDVSKFYEMKFLDIIKKTLDNDIKFLESKLRNINPREISSKVRDYKGWALDDVIMNIAITRTSNVSKSRTEHRRRIVRIAFIETQERNQDMIKLLNNLNKLEGILKKNLLIDINIRSDYQKGLVFF